MPARFTRRIVATLVCLLLLPAAVSAHVRLESSVPAHNAVLTTAPTYLQLHFSAHIEQRYTELALIGPDGRQVPLGAIRFLPGSDRAFEADVPPLAGSGQYTIRWRTAGADGHPLEGTISFALSLATDTVGSPVTADTLPAVTDHQAHMDEATAEASAAGVTANLPHTLARVFHFIALTLLLGGLACRVLLMPRLALAGDVALEMRRRVWRAAAFATLALVVAALLRLWLQSAVLHGSDRAWQMPLLSIMLTGTSWGRAWVIQAALLGLFAAALAAARPHSDRAALFLAVPAALGLAAIPALSGHAAGVDQAAVLSVINDTVHVVAAGAWLGMLALVVLAGLPALVRRDAAPERAVADMIDRFSPLALTAAALLVATGVVNSLIHFDSLAQLTQTDYGRTLLIKLSLIAGVLAAGAYNWRRQRPSLGAIGSADRLRRSIALELAFAVAVLTITGYLTGLPTPG